MSKFEFIINLSSSTACSPSWTASSSATAWRRSRPTGEAYMAVSGVPEARPDHAAALADLALDMREALAGLVDPKGRAVPVRIGIASGAVVAGVVGTHKFFYDVWGDPVNIASRVESTG
jgi:adenylate cyclase